jgi:hypothetical protein
MTESDINILFTMINGDPNISDMDERLNAILSQQFTSALYPQEDTERSKSSLYLAVANKTAETDTMATKWTKFASVDTMNAIAMNLALPQNADHAALAKSIFTHASFSACKDPLKAGVTKEQRYAYLHALSTPKPSQPSVNALTDLATKLADASTSPKKKRKILEQQLAALNEDKPDDDSSDSDDDDIQKKSKGTAFAISDFSTFNLHNDDVTLLSENKFVSLAALHTGKGPQQQSKRSQRTLVIPTQSNAASAVLTIASQIVCKRKGCSDWATPNFTYIQYIVSLFTFLTAAGVHEVDRLCRSYCCDNDQFWSIPTEIFHQIVCTMIATCRSHISICSICGNKDCSSDRCNFSQPSSSTTLPKSNHNGNNGRSNSNNSGNRNSKSGSVPYKHGVCSQYNRASGCNKGNCSFEHKCSGKNCNKTHPWTGNH